MVDVSIEIIKLMAILDKSQKTNSLLEVFRLILSTNTDIVKIGSVLNSLVR